MAKRALVIGATGQDGAYLCRYLLDRGYEVHGVKRRSSSFNTGRIDNLYKDPLERETRFYLHFGDLGDGSSMSNIIARVAPEEIYNLGAQSHVDVSFELVEYTADINALGPLRILEAIRALGLANQVRYYQASTSELYGGVAEASLNEHAPFLPKSPYAIAKLHAYWTTVLHREAYDLHASNGILFNHESPIRGETFVSRKITRAVAAIEHGLQDALHLGNLNARRDWGHARDYVEGIWLMLQHSQGDDYVLATGISRTVREFVETAFAQVGRSIGWEGTGLDEIGRDGRTGAVLVRCNSRYLRPVEVNTLLGDASKARDVLGWRPQTTFEDLVNEMVAADMQRAAEGTLLKGRG
jgi:GDPmannose 4,6-dehydratase